MPDIVEWFCGDVCCGRDDKETIEGFGGRRRAAGLPPDRPTLHLRTLHPQIIVFRGGGLAQPH